jgi:hypothetical protein
MKAGSVVEMRAGSGAEMKAESVVEMRAGSVVESRAGSLVVMKAGSGAEMKAGSGVEMRAGSVVESRIETRASRPLGILCLMVLVEEIAGDLWIMAVPLERRVGVLEPRISGMSMLIRRGGGLEVAMMMMAWHPGMCATVIIIEGAREIEK